MSPGILPPAAQLQLLAVAVLVGRVVSRPHLPPTGDAGLDGEEFRRIVAVGRELVLNDGTRADDAHGLCQDENRAFFKK